MSAEHPDLSDDRGEDSAPLLTFGGTQFQDWYVAARGLLLPHGEHYPSAESVGSVVALNRVASATARLPHLDVVWPVVADAVLLVVELLATHLTCFEVFGLDEIGSLTRGFDSGLTALDDFADILESTVSGLEKVQSVRLYALAHPTENSDDQC